MVLHLEHPVRAAYQEPLVRAVHLAVQGPAPLMERAEHRAWMEHLALVVTLERVEPVGHLEHPGRQALLEQAAHPDRMGPQEPPEQMASQEHQEPQAHPASLVLLGQVVIREPVVPQGLTGRPMARPGPAEPAGLMVHLEQTASQVRQGRVEHPAIPAPLALVEPHLMEPRAHLGILEQAAPQAPPGQTEPREHHLMGPRERQELAEQMAPMANQAHLARQEPAARPVQAPAYMLELTLRQGPQMGCCGGIRMTQVV